MLFFRKYLGGLLLLALSSYLGNLYFTNKLGLYITPRFFPYTLGALFVLVPMGLFSLWAGWKNRFSTHLGQKPYIVFTIVILTAWFTPPTALNPAMATQKNSPFTSSVSSAIPAAPEAPTTFEELVSSPMVTQAELDRLSGFDDDEAAAMGLQPSKPSRPSVHTASAPPNKVSAEKQDDKLDELVLTPQNYLSVMEDLFQKPDAYSGRPIRIEGFVYREKGFQPNQFVVARYQVVCCIADATVIGLLVEGLPSPAEDTWVEVKGILSKGSYNGSIMPILQAKEIHPIKIPADPYIYKN
ncbi:TIGR03943 family protein [Heliobacillus mobilis]|uniref:TIGR03943 family protein n=1 Tax=Heliobacterium mobile TaxID=28064 RepID=A0A6I3SPE1_HELMO|nr:TIGR03943 family protein [Heliobacterium mobile]MTV50923.1 TIGR03943 family protein [Heliobacterium mobile]